MLLSLRTYYIQPLRPKVTWDLTKMCKLISKPLASGVITSTVKWASNSRHIQSIICQPNKMEKGQWNESKSKSNISKTSGEIEDWGKKRPAQKVNPYHLSFVSRTECSMPTEGLYNNLVMTLILTWDRVGDLTSGFGREASWQYLR